MPRGQRAPGEPRCCWLGWPRAQEGLPFPTLPTAGTEGLSSSEPEYVAPLESNKMKMLIMKRETARAIRDVLSKLETVIHMESS